MTIDNNNNAEKVITEICNPTTGEVLALTMPKQKNITISITQQDIEDVRLAKENLKSQFNELTKEVITRENWKTARHNAKQCNKLKEEIELYVKSQLENPEGLLKSYKNEIREFYSIIKEAREHWKNQEDLVYLNEFRVKLKVLIQDKILEEYKLKNIEEEYQDITEVDIEKLLLKTHAGMNEEDDFDTMYLTKACKEKISALIQNCENKKLKRQMRWIEFENAIEKANLQPEFAIDKEELKPYIDSDNFTAILQTAINKAMAKQKAVEERIARERREAEEKIRKEAERKLKEEQDKRKAEEELRKQAEQKVEVVEKVLVEIEQKVEILEKKVEAPIILQKETSKLEKAKIFKFEVSCISYYEANTDSDETYNKIRMHYKNLGFDNVKIKLIETKNI